MLLQCPCLQATFTATSQLRAKPYLFSGYITLTPMAEQPLPAKAAMLRKGISPSKADQDPSSLRTAQQAGLPPAEQVKPVPLVVPYQGFSQNYTNMPMLPPHDAKTYPAEIQDLRGLLHVCYAAYDPAGAFDEPAALADTAAGPETIEVQDGTLGRKQVSRCQHDPAHNREVTKLHLDDIKAGRGVVMLSAALQRPALRISLVLYDTDDCRSQHSTDTSSSSSRTAGAATGSKVVQEHGRRPLSICSKHQGAAVGAYKGLVGEVWRYNTPSRDYPGSMYAYYSSTFKGNVAVRHPKTEEVTGSVPVLRGKMYRMRVYIVAPLAAADRAAGEQYKTWKVRTPALR